MKRAIAIFAVLLAGCATTVDPSGKETIKPVDFTQTELATVTHADLQAAAARAEKNGFPARAGVWRSFDIQLTAWEQQANACAAAIKAAIPSAGQPPFAGAFDALEAAAEAVGQGIPSSLKINCTPLPIPKMPFLPLIPKL